MKPRLLAVAMVALALLSTSHAWAWWAIELSAYRCEALWVEQGGWLLRLVADHDTYSRRLERHPELDPRDPVLQWYHRLYRGQIPPYERLLGVEEECGYFSTNDSRNGTCTLPWDEEETNSIELEARIFPDDGEGFFPITAHAVTYWPDSEAISGVVEWTGFDHHDRLGSWSMAKETSDDEGVRLPEVRLIFKWTNRIPIYFEPPIDEYPDVEGNAVARNVETEFFVDYPLWRLSNVMNKLERCGEELIIDIYGGADPSVPRHQKPPE